MRILFIDDNEDITTVVEAYGCSLGYKVDIDNDSENVSSYDLDLYHLVVLDVDMPKLNGYEVYKYIRSVNDTVPILFLSAMVEKKFRMEGLELGGTDYLLKPIDMDELFVKIATILRGFGTLQLGEFKISEVANKISYMDTDLELSDKAKIVLGMLLKKHGNIVTKNEISERLNNTNKTSRNVDVYICEIRKVLGNQSVLTFSRQGYVFDWDRINLDEN